MKHLLFTLILSITIFSVNFAAPESPEFVRTKNWKIEKIASGNLVLSTVAVFYNPNKAKAKLLDIDLDVVLGETKAGNISQLDEKVKIKKESAFEIPLQINIEPETSAWGYASGFITALTLQDIEVEIKGKIKISVLGIPLKIKVDEKEVLNAKDIF